MQIARFAFRNLWRDLKSGELSVLLLALTVAVLSLTAVGFFTSVSSNGKPTPRASRRAWNADAVFSDETRGNVIGHASTVRFSCRAISTRVSE